MAANDTQISWLVENYGGLLYRVAFAVVGNRQLAEDVVQEVLVKAWTSMPSWDGDEPIRWARVVTRNTAISTVRSVAGRPFEPLDPDDGSLVSGAADADFERSEEVAEMWAALGRLDDDSRLLLVLHEVDGLSYEQIVEATDLTMSAVKSKLYRARLTLRKAMNQ
ncbi:RNA polymerase sigma factor [Ilumatobacter coccineus]|nr:sigma-70 family RNA polymerase sigma factor [Ilumatobacter coccineus]